MQTQPDTHSPACGVVTHCRLHSACMDFIPVYQPSTRSTAGKPCAPRLSGGFLFAVLGAGLPDVYQDDFLREKPAGFSLFFAFSARFGTCKGRYAVIVGGIFLFLLVSGTFSLVLAEISPPSLNLKGGIPMRNLKRALSLGLTAAMISGLMVMGSRP